MTIEERTILLEDDVEVTGWVISDGEVEVLRSIVRALDNGARVETGSIFHNQIRLMLPAAKPKPCPFCGAECGLRVEDTRDGVYVRCGDCLARGSIRSSGSHKDAVEAWNRDGRASS